MTSKNPFEDPVIASNYERWYYTRGKKSVEEEKALIKRFIEGYQNAATILEVGCGTGYFTSWFEELGLIAVGLDHSGYMIKEAHENHHLDCLQGNGLFLPFERKSFDLVSLITTLEFIAEPAQILAEALRVARQGIVLGVVNKYSLLGLRLLRKAGPIWSQARLFSPGELISMLKKMLPRRFMIQSRTTLWPFFGGASKLPWGGFIVINVRLANEVKEDDLFY